jgi:hypothetical protein
MLIGSISWITIEQLSSCYEQHKTSVGSRSYSHNEGARRVVRGFYMWSEGEAGHAKEEEESGKIKACSVSMQEGPTMQVHTSTILLVVEMQRNT